MSPTTKRILLSCLVLSVVICACVSLISLAASGLILLRPASPVAIDTPPNPVHVPGESTPESPGSVRASPTPASTEMPALETETPGSGAAAPTAAGPGASLPPDITRQMDEIQQQVVGLRKLDAKKPVDRKLLTQAELAQHVKDDFLKDYTSDKAKNDAIELATFGLLEPGFDLYTFYKDLYTEQIAGFYDDKVKAMYVIAGEGFQGPERLTYSHEFTHALQDQHYDIENGLKQSEKECEKDSERCAAVQALLEGDATVLEYQWFSNYATPDDARQIQDFYASYKSPVYDSAPDFMKQDFLFPYQTGQKFVQALIDKGGWEAVNGAYGNPPVSTEQILHPERYPDDQPVAVTIPDLAPILGDGWKKIEQNDMGEWYTYLILAHGLNEKTRLGEDAARKAAEGWGGDNYAIYTNETTGDVAMVLDTKWDTVKDAREFAAAFRRYATARFGDPATSQGSDNTWNSEQGTQAFHLDTDRTVWIQAVEDAQAGAIWQALKGE